MHVVTAHYHLQGNDRILLYGNEIKRSWDIARGGLKLIGNLQEGLRKGKPIRRITELSLNR